jgi:hypothetical protein
MMPDLRDILGCAEWLDESSIARTDLSVHDPGCRGQLLNAPPKNPIDNQQRLVGHRWINQPRFAQLTLILTLVCSSNAHLKWSRASAKSGLIPTA